MGCILKLNLILSGGSYGAMFQASARGGKPFMQLSRLRFRQVPEEESRFIQSFQGTVDIIVDCERH